MTNEEPKSITTNEVLAEKINGLSRTTDINLANIKESLARIERANTTFATKGEVNEIQKDFNATIKRMEDKYSEHDKHDKVSFDSLNKGQESVKKIVWTGVGVIGTISFFSPLVFRYVFKI